MNFNLNISSRRQAEIRYPSPKGSELIVSAPFRVGANRQIRRLLANWAAFTIFTNRNFTECPFSTKYLFFWLL